MSAWSGKPDRAPGAGAALGPETLLGAFDGLARDAHLRERFGELGPAFSTAFGSLVEPFAVAMRELRTTPHSQSAARALTDIARMTGRFTGELVQRLADEDAPETGSTPGDRYAALASRVDDSFREFTSTPEFDKARRSAAAAVLDWLEQDRISALAIARALEPVRVPVPVPPHYGDVVAPKSSAAVRLDGNATLVRHPAARGAHASVLVVPGFTAGAEIFDLDPQRSVVRTLAEHGVEAWLLDWGRSDEADGMRTVANQLDRIDRALDLVSRASTARPPALAGHFHGGLLALLHCLRHPGRAGALVAISTPVEFRSRHDAFADWLRACDGNRLVEAFGNIPGALTVALLAAASPMEWCGGGFFTLLAGMDSPADLTRIARLEQARRFPPAFPGETFRALYGAFYRDNGFVEGGAAVLDGARFDLSGLGTPVLNVFSRDDRIVPPDASAPLPDRVTAAVCTNRERAGGHYDLLAGDAMRTELLPDIAAWLIEHAR